MAAGRSVGLELLFKSCSKALTKGEKKEEKLHTKAKNGIIATVCSQGGMKRFKAFSTQRAAHLLVTIEFVCSQPAACVFFFQFIVFLCLRDVNPCQEI